MLATLPVWQIPEGSAEELLLKPMAPEIQGIIVSPFPSSSPSNRDMNPLGEVLTKIR